MKIDILDELLDTRDHLSQLIIHRSVGPAGTKEEFDALVLQRDRLTIAINKVLEEGFQASTDGLEKAHQELTRQNAALDKAVKTEGTIKDAAGVVAKVLAALGPIVAFVV